MGILPVPAMQFECRLAYSLKPLQSKVSLEKDLISKPAPPNQELLIDPSLKHLLINQI